MLVVLAVSAFVVWVLVGVLAMVVGAFLVVSMPILALFIALEPK